MARIRMNVDAYDAQQAKPAENKAEHGGVLREDTQKVQQQLISSDVHWRFGAPRSKVDSRFALQDAPGIDAELRTEFDAKLRAFLRSAFPDASLRADGEEQILVCNFNCSSRVSGPLVPGSTL